MIGIVLGGVGLFLLGMSMLTDGLQIAAGDRLRDGLRRYTRSRWSSVLTGAVGTAVVQSSSATTLLVIGFVGAGLLTLPAALGVVFGANVGTTLTAWIVAGVGLKLQVSTFALPIVGVGALTRLFTRGRRAALGTALAGFGLVFVGIDVLQGGMETAAQHVDLARFAGRGPLALLVLVLVGTVMTVVMQSSSAAVATTLAAVSGGTIGLVQAAALVIGQNVGTTVTAGIGAIGGSAVVRRTALAHLLFNVVTAVVALGLLPLLWPLGETQFAESDPAIVISAFHTAFNLLGVAMFIPVIPRLAGWLERWVQERGAELTHRLATGRAASPAAVLEACRLTAHDAAAALLDSAVAILDEPGGEDAVEPQREAIHQALDATRQKLCALSPEAAANEDHQHHVSLLHAIDHLHRLEDALGERGRRAVCFRHDGSRALAEGLREHLRTLAGWTRTRQGPAPDVTELSASLADARRTSRPAVLEQTARGALDPEESERLLEAIRWIDRLAYHTARAHHHLDRAYRPQPPEPAPSAAGLHGEESYDALPASGP